MRVSTAHQYATFSKSIQESQSRFLEAQRAVTSGKRLREMSDDPASGGTVLRMGGVKEALGQYKANLGSARGWIGFSESVLGEVGSIMQGAVEKAVKGANGITDQAGREAMAREVEGLQRRLLELANSQGPGGQYLFAGHKTATKPYTITLTTVGYNGDAGNVNVEVGAGETLTINTPGGALFVDAYAALESLKTHLIGGDIGALSGIDLPALQASMKSVNQARGEAGARLGLIADLESQHERRIEDLTSKVSDLEDIDLAEAVTAMQAAQTAYHAALQVTTAGASLSLMDFLTR